MKKMIYIIKTLDTLFTSYFDESVAKEELKKREEFFTNEFGNLSLETSILIFSDDDIKTIISENIHLAKELLKEEKSGN